MQFWWRTHHVFLDPFRGSTMPTLGSCLAWMDQKGKRLHPKHSQALGDPGILYPTAPGGPGPCTLRHGVIRGSCIPQLPACLTRLPPLLQCHPHRGKAAPSILFIPHGHELNGKAPLSSSLSSAGIREPPAWRARPGHAPGWTWSTESCASCKWELWPWRSCGPAWGARELAGHCCGSADGIRHRWETRSCQNEPGLGNVIIGMVNKFTRTLLRQGIAMVTAQKSLGMRKGSIRGGSRGKGPRVLRGSLPGAGGRE